MRIATVLGGGGPIGIAWETGMLLGLADEGIDLRSSTIIGTSAGAIVGANLAISGDLEVLYHQQSTLFEGEDLTPPDMGRFMAAWTKAKLLTRGIDGLRRSLGKSAVAANIGGTEEWLAGIGRRLPSQAWPADAELRVVAIEIATGKLVVWDRNSGAGLRDAVAASCAVPCVFPLVEIQGQVYMDGGMGSPTNAHLAEGHGQVLVFDPLGRIPGVSTRLKEEVAALSRSGSEVKTFTPDDATSNFIGFDLMDAAKCSQVAQLGRKQGRTVAALEGLHLLRA